MSETLPIYTATGFDASQTNVKGYKIVTDVSGIIVSAALNSNQTDGVTFEIRASNATTVLATASVSGGVATWNYETAAGTYYIVHNTSSKRQCYKNSGVSYPVNGTDINVTAGYSSSDGGDQTNVAWNFDSVTFQAVTNATVTPAAQTLTLAQPAAVAGVSMTVTPSALSLTLAQNGVSAFQEPKSFTGQGWTNGWGFAKDKKSPTIDSADTGYKKLLKKKKMQGRNI